MSNRKFFQIDTSHLIIGSTSGSSKDAKLFVESQIERYCDIPKKSKYRLVKDGKDQWHFEIQENPVSGSIIDHVIKEIDENNEIEIFIFGSDDEQYHIYKRPDGTLRTFIRRDSERVMPVDEKVELLSGEPKKLNEFFSLFYVYTWASGAVFVLSLSVALVAGFISAGIQTAENGYREAINNNPVSFLIENKMMTVKYESESTDRLPGIGGIKAMNDYLNSGRNAAVGQLVFNKGNWKVEPKRPSVSGRVSADVVDASKGIDPKNNNNNEGLNNES